MRETRVRARFLDRMVRSVAVSVLMHLVCRTPPGQQVAQPTCPREFMNRSQPEALLESAKPRNREIGLPVRGTGRWPRPTSLSPCQNWPDGQVADQPPG